VHFIKNLHYIIFIFIITLCFSCKKSVSDLTPSYISIDSIGFVTNSLQGSASHNITDAWIYLNDNVQGIYELPCKFPVLAEGMQKITIRPGIKINGIASTRMYYPFYKPIDYNINLVKDSTIHLSPVTSYNPAVVLAWMEDFEDGGISLERTSKSQVNIGTTSDLQEVFQGNYSAKIILDSNRTIFECYTIDSYVLNGNAINFLEFNYKNNCEVSIGVFVYSTNATIQRSVLVLNKSSIWKKIYVNLSNAVSENMTATNFKVFIGIQKDASSSENPVLYLDNLKLIHY